MRLRGVPIQTTLLIAFLTLPAAAGPRAPAIRKVDFRNFTFPALWTKRPITLREGRHSFEKDSCLTEYKLESVIYKDLTGDGMDEAIAEVSDFTACGSSYFTSYYFVFALRGGRVLLMKRLSRDFEPDQSK